MTNSKYIIRFNTLVALLGIMACSSCQAQVCSIHERPFKPKITDKTNEIGAKYEEINRDSTNCFHILLVKNFGLSPKKVAYYLRIDSSYNCILETVGVKGKESRSKLSLEQPIKAEIKSWESRKSPDYFECICQAEGESEEILVVANNALKMRTEITFLGGSLSEVANKTNQLSYLFELSRILKRISS